MVAVWIFIGLLGLSLLGMILSQAMVGAHRVEESKSPADFGLAYEPAVFTTKDGIRLMGWWIPAESSAKTVIFLHGYHGSKSPDLQYANFLHDEGYNLLLFDMRAHGKSGGKDTSIGALERMDAAAAVDFVSAKGSRKIALLGFSMGGRVAVLTAAENTHVDAIICDCGPARIRTSIVLKLESRRIPHFIAVAVAAYILYGASLRCLCNLFKYEPLHRAALLEGTPALFIQGKNDPNIRVSETVEMARRAGSKADLWLVDDAAHRDVSDLHPQEYRARLSKFLAASLGT